MMQFIDTLSPAEADVQELDVLYERIRTIAKRNGINPSNVHSAIDSVKLSILKQPVKQYMYD